MDVDVRPHLDFLDLDRLLLLAGLGGLFLGLVLVPAIVEKLGDGRDGIGGDLDEIQSGLLSELKGAVDRDGAVIDTLRVDQLDLGDPNFLVDARAILGDGRRGSVGSANGGSLLLLLIRRMRRPARLKGAPRKDSGNRVPKSTDSTENGMCGR
jgi:hypothetical protein